MGNTQIRTYMRDVSFYSKYEIIYDSIRYLETLANLIFVVLMGFVENDLLH